MEAANGVATKKYPWRMDILNSVEAVDKEAYQQEAEHDPLWSNVNSIGEKDPMIWEVSGGKVALVTKEKIQEEDGKPYCRFWNDRAYIILCWHKSSILTDIYDLHLWVSKHCTREDYILAVKKVEQLNMKLKEKPIIHREIQLHESDTLHSYFKVELRRMSRGPKEHSSNPKLDNRCLLQFHVEDADVKGNKRQWMVERKFLRGNLCSDDVFVIMDEHYIYQWNGAQSNESERKAAQTYIKQKERNSSLRFKPPVINEGVNDRDHPVYNLFPTTGKKPKANVVNEKKKVKKLYKITSSINSNGEYKHCAKEDERTICKSNLDSKCDTQPQLYVWIGDEVSFQEKMRAMLLAEDFLMTEYHDMIERRFNQPWNKTITIVTEDNRYHAFDRALMH